MREFNQGLSDVAVAVTNTTAAALASTFIVARSSASPGGETARIVKSTQVRPDFNQQHHRRILADARNRLQQVELLVRFLPFVAEENCFSLRGGTAINLLIRNLPRLSVDIDLAYLPVIGREESLHGIDTALRKIENRIKKLLPLVRVQRGKSLEEGTIN